VHYLDFHKDPLFYDIFQEFVEFKMKNSKDSRIFTQEKEFESFINFVLHYLLQFLKFDYFSTNFHSIYQN
jgi:hypothetical protein